MSEFKKLDDMLAKPTSVDISLHFDKRYEDYPSFYEDTKKEVYRAIVQLFKTLSESTSDKKVLTVSAVIKGILWNTDFIASRIDRKTVESSPFFDKSILTEMIPFFEEIEDYEFCSTIMKIYDGL